MRTLVRPFSTQTYTLLYLEVKEQYITKIHIIYHTNCLSKEAIYGKFIITSLLWTFALYGLFEICKTIIHIHKYPKVSFNGSSFIITVHNQENNIEYFLRVFIYKMLYYNLNISEIIIVDLDSTDNTLNILKTFSKDFDFIKVLTLNEYKELLA